MSTEDEATKAYAEGRGDQFEDDCAVVQALLDELNDADVYRDGFINTTRVREMLAHFDIPKLTFCSCPIDGWMHSECDDMGCRSERNNDARYAAIEVQANRKPAEAQQ